MIATRVPDTLADVLHALGDIPPDRVLWTPRPGTATEADLLRTRGTELVDGVLVLKSAGMAKGLSEVVVCGRLFNFIRPDQLGCVTVASGPFRISPGVVRRPDVAFARWDKVLHGGRTIPDIVDDAPDLVIDIPTDENTPAEQSRKYREYLAAGTAVIWEIDPDTRTVTEYGPESHRVFTATADTLDGGTVLPGFSLPLADLFNEPQLNPRPAQG